MIGFLAIVYALLGAAAATEVALRMRDTWLQEHVEFRPDAEDVTLVVLAGVLWPLTLVALGWLKFYGWRKEQGDGPA